MTESKNINTDLTRLKILLDAQTNLQNKLVESNKKINTLSKGLDEQTVKIIKNKKDF